MRLELTESERDLLVTLLQERQRELLHEISKAEVHRFQRTLQERERMLESTLQKLAAANLAT